jgi:hypothetical protein
MSRIAVTFVLVSAALVVFACSDDEHSHGHTSFPACEEISSACHDLDTGSGFAHDCHELAHGAKDEATCTAKKAECLAGCAKTDGGAATDAATGG